MGAGRLRRAAARCGAFDRGLGVAARPPDSGHRRACGAGRWRDSGMLGTPARRGQRFIDADEDETVGALVAIIREQRPHVVVTYDPNGGYGHPDHIHAHRVTTAAVAVAGAGAGDYPGEVVTYKAQATAAGTPVGTATNFAFTVTYTTVDN